ncbi:MAG TPA: hypothetical protein VGO76_21970 [Luteibacter sp.]|jgi:hypothetical protein|nr:hypothetical protein [Luteibacter sp.]
MKTVSKRWLSVLFAIACTAPVMASAADAPKAAPPSDKDLASTHCVIGEEKFLPGDYYYCIASQSYGQHDYVNAKRFFTTAASWASKPAQYVLGVMALNGDQQPANRPLALAWLSLAAERANSSFKADYQAAYDSATAADQKAAEDLLAKMKPVYADATAASRAEQRYAQGMAMLSRLDTGGSTYCMAGIAAQDESAASASQSCPQIQVVAAGIDRAAVAVFDGWAGHVSVGPLQQAEAPKGVK